MSELFDLAASAAANTERFPEGMQFRNVNDGGRELEAILGRHYKDTSGVLSAGGSVNAFAVTTNRTLTTLAQGMRVAFKANVSITGACTLNINGGGAKDIVAPDGSDLIAGDILEGQIVEVVYRTDLLKWQMVSQSAREIPDTDAIQAAAADYISDNADDVRDSIWVMRPIVSATTATAPTGATDGALYLVPTGASGSTWASNIGSIAEAIGGSWTYHTPAAGWSVFARDTDTVYVYDTAWNAIVSDDPGTSTLQSAVFQHQESSGVDAGASVIGWNERTLNTTTSNSISGASLSANAMIMPTGTYLVSVSAIAFPGSVGSDFQIKLSSTGQTFLGLTAGGVPSGEAQPPSTLCSTFPVTVSAETESFRVYTYHSVAKSNDGLGQAIGTGGDEVYVNVSWLKIDAARGLQGDDGDPGADGAGYLASSSTSTAIGTGSKTFATQSGLAYRAGDIVRIADTAAPSTNYMLGTITSYSTTSMVVTVTETAGSGTKTAWTISLAGATGAAGGDGAGYGGTSTTSLAIGTGSKDFTTQAGLAYVVGSRARASNSSTNWMEGVVTDYTGTSLTISVDKTAGSGTLASWSLSIAGQPGADGAGSGTVTDIAASGGVETVSGSAITSSGEMRGSHLVNAQTGTSYTFVAGDRGKVVSFTNGSPVAVTLPQAQSATAAAVGYTGWYVLAINDGAGAVTITPTSSTIGGASSLGLSQHQGALIVSDGTNYKRFYLSSSGSVDLYTLIDALTAETAPSASDTIPIKDVSAAAAREMTLADVFKTINALGAETAPAADDTLALYDTSASEADTITLADLFKVIAGLTALTAVDAADSLAVYDASAAGARVATVSNVFAALNTLTEDTAPSMTADYMVTYDASGAAAKKALLGKVGVGKYSFYVDTGQMKNTTTGAKTGATLVANRDFGLTTNDSAGGSVLSFSATAKNHAWFKLAMPKSWDLGSLVARFFWTADTGTGTVEWEIAAASVGDGDALSFTFGTAATVTDAIGTLTNLHATAETSGFSASGSPAARDIVWFEVVRDGQAGNTDDTFSAAALLIGVEITINRSANTDD